MLRTVVSPIGACSFSQLLHCCFSYFWDARLRRRLSWHTTQKKTRLYDCCCLFWDARLKRRVGYETLIVYFGTRESEKKIDFAIDVVCFCTRDSEEDLALDYENIIVCLGTRDSAEDWTMQLLYSAERLCLFLGGAQTMQLLHLALRLFFFLEWNYCFFYSWDARLR